MKRAFFSPSGIQHTYQRTCDKGVFLYKTSERLMLFTILSVIRDKHNVRVCGLAFMFTHIHSLIRVCEKKDIGEYFGHAISLFVREINEFTGRNGQMFDTVGSCSKVSSKRQKEAVCYIYNNSVEKKLFNRAIEDRWNFLAYYLSDHPFSEYLVKRHATYKLRKSCKEVDNLQVEGKYLNLATIYRLFDGLGTKETEQLIDYIITKYNFINYQDTIDLYDGFEEMVHAINSTGGKEFDLPEEYDSESEKPYLSMLRFAERMGLIDKRMRIYSLSNNEKEYLSAFFRKHTSASDRQIKRFLHFEA